ncbi:MAG: hypothetical protein D4R69_03770 [Actinomycetales bacterium]|nr:MAG: hypothetical protein D4R69_03770 [Actinomycetales bacterium]
MSNLIDLINAGSINAGEELIWKRRAENQGHFAVVNLDGSISTSDGIKHRTPSGAARHLNGGRPVDGWLTWKLKRTGKSLSSLRSV